MRILVVTAVAAERDAIAAALHADADTDADFDADADTELIVAGVGPAAAAAATSAALAATRAELVLSAGIGGGFGMLVAGDIAVASTIAFADLGAETAAGFVPAAELGFGIDSYPVPAKLAVQLADRTGGHLGTVVTVATVTGTAESAAALVARYPDAVAEGMEGAGVAAAAAVHGIPVAELRAISNAVGPRDRDAWQVSRALEALGRAVASVLA